MYLHITARKSSACKRPHTETPRKLNQNKSSKTQMPAFSLSAFNTTETTDRKPFFLFF